MIFATYQGGSGAEVTGGIARDSLGNVYLAGSTQSTDFPVASASGGGFVSKFDPNGNRLADILIPGVVITAIAVDASNNVVIAEGAASEPGNFIPGTPLIGFVSKLDSALTQTLWTANVAALPAALVLDSSGIYVAGVARDGFSTTPGALQPANRGGANAFVLKLSSGGTVIYATYLGGSGTDYATAIAVDTAGDVYLTGSTTSSDFPVVSAQQGFGGVVGTLETVNYGDAFVAKLDPKGATLIYSTYLGGAAADVGYAIAADSSGNAYVAGGTESASWLAGPALGTFQTAYAGPAPDPDDPYPDGDAFVAKFSAAGALAWYTYLGGAGYDGATAIALDSSGNIYVAGNTDSTDFPKAGNPAPDCHIGERPFLAAFDPTGAKLLLTSGISGMGYDQVSALAFDTAHNVAYLAGDVQSVVFFSTPGAAQASYGGGADDSFVVALNLAAPPSLQVSCVVNAASFIAGNASSYPTGAVAPGEIVSLFGAGLGPTPAALTQLTGAGTVATSLGGTTVLFDGLPAPLLYAANGQINAVVPYGIDASVTKMTVESGSFEAGPIPMPVEAAVPAIFSYDGSGTGEAAVVNSDGSINSVSNPATRGDWIEFFLCGAGMMSNSTDGAVTPLTPPFPMPSQVVTVTIRGVNAQVLYAGAAPGDVNGALQIDVVVPTGINFGNSVPLAVTVGNYSSQADITIAIQ